MQTVPESITIGGMPNKTIVNLLRLKELMREKGWKAGELATYSGVKYDTVYSLVTGRRPNSNVATVKQIADALDVSVDYLLGLSDERMPSGEVMPAELRRLLSIAGDLPAMRQEELTRIAGALVELERERMARTIPIERMRALIEADSQLAGRVNSEDLLRALQLLMRELPPRWLIDLQPTEQAAN